MTGEGSVHITRFCGIAARALSRSATYWGAKGQGTEMLLWLEVAAVLREGERWDEAGLTARVLHSKEDRTGSGCLTESIDKVIERPGILAVGLGEAGSEVGANTGICCCIEAGVLGGGLVGVDARLKDGGWDVVTGTWWESRDVMLKIVGGWRAGEACGSRSGWRDGRHVRWWESRFVLCLRLCLYLLWEVWTC